MPGHWLAPFSRLYKVSLVLKGNCHNEYINLHRRYGPVVRTGPKHVSVSDPAAIPTIYGITSKFVKDDFYKPFGAKYEGKTFDNMFATRDPVEHKRLKVPVSQKYSMASIRTFEPMADECTDIFMAAMRDLQGQKVDLGEWLQWYAFDVIAAMTFQARFGFMEKRTDVEGMIGSIEKALVYGAVVGQVSYLHDYLLGNDFVLWLLKTFMPQLPNPIAYIIEISLREIKRYDQEGVQNSRGDFLALLRNDRKVGKSTMSDRDMLNHLSNNLLAGSDTTGISLRAIFYYLMKHPSVYKKLLEEIDTANAEGKLSKNITYAECLQLPYLQAVMKESMRLHPGVQMPLERIVPQGGAHISGWHIPAGTVIGVNPIVIHHNKDIFGADDSEFRPERWITSSEEQLKAMDRCFLAFGHGSRTCIGKNISIMEMGKLVPQILREFDVEWASDEPQWKLQTYWFSKQIGVITRLKPRHRDQ
ncbi:cytochrome P450 [Fusarium redolens]|uniref:Cytochrome P450 n=1 Tax=Fusarium redolens TaxID=48865 RepID=A0A9P9JK50_FUSRE|nr:cytochrome P450 [Fusarium redolens]KAH7205129.1 cytochrome P450 [Fusarium redolens]